MAAFIEPFWTFIECFTIYIFTFIGYIYTKKLLLRFHVRILLKFHFYFIWYARAKIII